MLVIVDSCVRSYLERLDCGLAELAKAEDRLRTKVLEAKQKLEQSRQTIAEKVPVKEDSVGESRS